MFKHILDLHAVDLSEIQGVLKRASGLIGVDVDFDEIQVTDADQTVAQLGKLVAQLVDIRFGSARMNVLNEELGAISKFNVVEIVNVRGEDLVLLLNGGDGLLGGGLGYLLPFHHHQKGFKDAHQAHTARIYDARFFEDGEHIGGVFQNQLTFLNQLFKHRFKTGVIAFGHANGTLRDHAHHGKNSAFFGLVDRAVSNASPFQKRLGEHLWRQNVGDRSDDIRKTFIDLRKDNAAVASCAAQRSGSQHGGEFGEIQVTVGNGL